VACFLLPCAEEEGTVADDRDRDRDGNREGVEGVENPWNELKRSEGARPPETDRSTPSAGKPSKAFPPGTYGELNYKEEDSPEGVRTEPDGSTGGSR
jgi:hypothetical protein